MNTPEVIVQTYSIPEYLELLDEINSGSLKVKNFVSKLDQLKTWEHLELLIEVNFHYCQYFNLVGWSLTWIWNLVTCD